MVDLPSQPLGDIDPEFQKIALETGDWTYALSGTSTREKLLINLVNDVCREHLGLAFRLHIQAALSHGVPFADLLGVVRFIGPYAGYPARPPPPSSGSLRSRAATSRRTSSGSIRTSRHPLRLEQLSRRKEAVVNEGSATKRPAAGPTAAGEEGQQIA